MENKTGIVLYQRQENKRMRYDMERKIGGYLAEEQKQPKKPTLVKPLPVRPQPNVTFGVGSSFQAWRKRSNYHHKLPTIAENDNHIPEENHTIGGGGAANVKDQDEKQFRRTTLNRLSARRSRLRTIAHMVELESKARSYKEKIAQLHQQIEAQERKNRLLQIEHHKLKYHMAASEKQRILQDVAMEKKRAEVDRLTEVGRQLAAKSKARKLNLGATLQLIPNSNSGFDGRKLDQALGGPVISKRQVDAVLRSQNQRQKGITKWDVGNRLIPNFNLVKSEQE